MNSSDQSGQKKRFNLAKLLKSLSLVCLILAVICFSYEPIKSHLVNHYQQRITRQTVTSGQRSGPGNYHMGQVKAVSITQVVSARMHAKRLPVIGQMLVPSVGLHLPIGKGVGSENLMLAAGTMKANQRMGHGNYALAGHHMINRSALFTPLWYHAHRGTRVYLTDMHRIYVYRINVRKIISPYDVNVINNVGHPVLTLITCNDSGSKRLLLRGKLIKSAPLSAAPQAIKKDANQPTNNHDVLKGY